MRKNIIVLIILALLITACSGAEDLEGEDMIPCDSNALIDAINNANDTPNTTDTINLELICFYELTEVDNTTEGYNGLPSIISPIVINGNGAIIHRSSAAGTPEFRLFYIAAEGSLTLDYVTLSNGNASTGADYLGTIGGAILNRGSLTITDSSFSGNSALEGGGAIWNQGSTLNSDLVIQNSTIAFNTAGGNGGAIDNGLNDVLIITNSTISGNSSHGIYNRGSASIMYSTIVNNQVTGVYSDNSDIQIGNSIIANNGWFDCYLLSGYYFYGVNLDTDGSCPGPGLLITADPLLGPLADNGGPTQTHALLEGSPALDAATDNCLVAVNDQDWDRPVAVEDQDYDRPFALDAATGGCFVAVSDQDYDRPVDVEDQDFDRPVAIDGHDWDRPVALAAATGGCLVAVNGQDWDRPGGTACDLGAYEASSFNPPPPPPPLPDSSIGTIDSNTFCYFSPDSNYVAAHSLQAGTQVEVVGYSEDLSYVAAISPRNPDLLCYVDKEYLTLPDSLDLQALTDPPPPVDSSDPRENPPDEPQGCHSGLSGVACTAAGGFWNISVNPAVCVCP